MDLVGNYYKNNERNSLFLHHSPTILRDKLLEIGGILNEQDTKQQQLHTIREFLKQQRSYTLFKNSTRRNANNRNPYRVYAIDQMWEMDLATLPKLKSDNFGYIHILTCIDAFSRYAFARPLRTKQPREIVKALNDIFQEGRLPNLLQFDKGGEFNSHITLSFLRNRGIKYRNPITTHLAKAGLIEAFNRSLKTRISRYLNWKNFTNQPNEKRWVDFLPAIMENYNNTRHSRTGFAPKAITRENATIVYKQQKQLTEKRFRKQQHQLPHLKTGNYVRTKRKRSTFEKGTMQPLWSDEIFRINRVILRNPFPVYELIDAHDRIIKGKLYQHELQQVNLSSDTPIKILRKPSIFDRQKLYEIETLDKRRNKVDLNAMKKNRQIDNYHDIVSSLMKIKK